MVERLKVAILFYSFTVFLGMYAYLTSCLLNFLTTWPDLRILICIVLWILFNFGTTTYCYRKNKTFKMPELKVLLAESLSRIGAEQWKKCVGHVIEEENKMKNLDGIIDRATDEVTPPFIINTGDTSSSTTDCSSDRD